MAVLKIHNGTSWDVAIAKVWDGSAWVETMKYYDGTSWVELYPTGPTVVVAPLKFISDTELSGTAYAYLGVDSDGDLKSSITGTSPNSVYETWLDGGLNSQVWVERVINSGSLTTDWGVGRKACTSDRVLGCQAAYPARQQANVTINFYDAASGGSLLDSQNVLLDADATGA